MGVMCNATLVLHSLLRTLLKICIFGATVLEDTFIMSHKTINLIHCFYACETWSLLSRKERRLSTARRSGVGYCKECVMQ
jgi:hypothetical protein